MNDKSSGNMDTEIKTQDASRDRESEKTSQSLEASDRPKKKSHDRPPDMVMKIGKTTYRVWAHFSQSSRETLDDKIKRMLRNDVRRMMQSV